MKATIDRFEDMYAVLVFDDGVETAWPKDKLPAGAREGSILDIAFQIDAAAEKDLRRSIAEAQRRLKGTHS